MFLDENRFELVASKFLEAAALPELWPSALQVLAEATGSAGAVLLPFPSSSPIFPARQE